MNQNRKAVVWSGIEKVGTYLVNFVIQIVLARLLCPDDYAVVAMLAIFFSISQAFIDSGFATTLIQKQDCTQADYSSVFFFNILVGGGVYLIFFFCAPLIEKFYDFPQLSLVTRIYSLNLFINSFALVHRVILTKQLKFKQIAVVTFTTSVASAIPGIIMAYFGAGYWALVGQSLLSALLSTILLMVFSKWRPSFVISKQSLLQLAPFGLRMLAVYIFHAIYNNIYSLLIGKKFTATELGYYDRGRTLSSTGPVGFSDFFTRALYPIQAKIQDKAVELEQSYNKSFKLICCLILPLSAYMAFFSKEVVFTLYGEKWLECASILSVLCIGYMFYPLQALNMNMLKVKAKGDYMLRSEVLKKVMGIVCVCVLINYNLTVVVWGWVVCSILEFIISELFFFHLYKLRIGVSITSLASSLALSYVLSFVIHSVLCRTITNMYIICIAGAVLFFAIYYLINIKNILQFVGKEI